MPENFAIRNACSNFAEKMEYKFKKAEAADMCLSIVSVIVGKYIDQMIEAKNDRIEMSIIRPHSKDAGKKIVIEVLENDVTSFKAIPLNTIKHGESKVWDFIEKHLPDYYHRDDILHYDIFSRFINHEDLAEGDAKWIYADFGSDREKVKATIEQMEKDFAYEALTNWLEHHGPEYW